MPKIHCPNHEDSTPSFHVYENGAYCFSCGYYQARGSPINGEELPKVPEVQPEDLNAAMGRIERLNGSVVRGIELPANEHGYFMVWPDKSYYKFRKFKGEPRYLAPKGHKQPLYTLEEGDSELGLVLVEGELNCLSLFQAGIDNVCSPGASGNFISLEAQILELAARYTQVAIWVDLDPAGIRALWHIQPKLEKLGLKVVHYASLEDANDVLVNRGAGALHKLVERILTGET